LFAPPTVKAYGADIPPPKRWGVPGVERKV
jgi:hypothetical protein